MLEHQVNPPLETTAAALPYTERLSISLPPQAHALLVGYLAQLQADSAERDTVRARLEELTAAFLELDPTPQDAVHSAIRQWETERQALENRPTLQREHKKRSSSHSARPATRTALKLFGGGALALCAMTPFFVGSTNPALFALMMFLFFGLPLLLGAAVGQRVRQRPVLGTFYAVSLLIPLVALVTELVMDLFTQYPHEGWMLGLDIALFWLPLGCLAAGLTSWGSNLLRKRHGILSPARGADVKSSPL